MPVRVPATAYVVAMLAVIGSTGYDVMLVLHIASAVVAFAPAFAHPLIERQTRSLDASSRGAVLGFLAQNSRRVYTPALILTGLFGFGLQGMSDGAIEFSQTWIWLAVVVWIAMNGVLHAMLLPGERALASGDESARQRVDIGGMIMTVLLLVILYLMVFQPGR
jgi:uncharacterized membrane protein